MAGAIANIVRKVMFAHIPKDGKSPVWNASSEKWEMIASPTAQQLEASANKLGNVSAKADSAMAEAESKVDAGEALEAARTGMIEVTEFAAHPAFRAIEFREQYQGAFKIYVQFGPKGQPITSSTQGWLSYADLEEFNDLVDRVTAIENKLGIK